MKIKLKKNVLINLSADIDVIPSEQTVQIGGGDKVTSSPCVSDMGQCKPPAGGNQIQPKTSVCPDTKPRPGNRTQITF